MEYLWLAIGLVGLGFLGYRGGCVWLDARRRGICLPERAGWALVGAFAPARYWWGARIEALSDRERQDLLTRETQSLGLSQADSLRCPLCEAEVAGAWSVTADGRPTVAPGPVECPECDFRLDACRHCTHFLPGPPQGGGGSTWVRMDLGSGRCSQYKALQPVEQACATDMARRLRARGYEQIRAPLPIVDSFLPPDHCRVFAPERKRIQQGEVGWPDARRTALLRLLVSPVPQKTSVPDTPPRGDEQWLV